MNEWVDSICAHLNLREQADAGGPASITSGNHYISSPLATSVPNSLSQFNTLPTLTPPTSSHYSPSGTLPVINMSSGIYSTQGQYSCLSQYGTTPSTAGTGGYIPSANYGTLSSTNYGTLSSTRGPPPSPPPPYNGVCSLIQWVGLQYSVGVA